MDSTLALRKFELKRARHDRDVAIVADIVGATKDVAVQVLKNPALSAGLSVALIEWLAKEGYINQTERAALAAVLISAGLLEAFKPITIGGIAQ